MTNSKEMRLIDAYALEEYIEAIHCEHCSNRNNIKCRVCEIQDCLDYIADATTVVEQKHGHWIVYHFLDTELECSECQYTRTFRRNDLPKENYPKFCEGCGAKMQGYKIAKMDEVTE